MIELDMTYFTDGKYFLISQIKIMLIFLRYNTGTGEATDIIVDTLFDQRITDRIQALLSFNTTANISGNITRV